MARLRTARLSRAYQVLYESISDTDLRRTLFETYRQPPRPSAAFAMLRTRFDPVLKQSDIEQKNLEWNGYSIVKDVGKSEDTITKAADLLDSANAERPVTERFDETQKSEKLLAMIAEASSHFQLDAQRELALPVGSRQYERENTNGNRTQSSINRQRRQLHPTLKL